MIFLLLHKVLSVALAVLLFLAFAGIIKCLKLFLIQKRVNRIKFIFLFFILFFVYNPPNSFSEQEIKNKSPVNNFNCLKTDLTKNPDNGRYTLSMIIDYAIKNNPRIRIAAKDIEAGKYGIDFARSERMLKIDGGSGITMYRYDMPLYPIVIEPPIGPGTDFPLFRRTILDAGFSFKLPLFRGGRLFREVNIAELKKSAAEDIYRMNKQELIYNISSTYYKIAQLEKLLVVNDASIKQIEAHKRNVEFYLKAGVVPKLDLLKTDVELAHAMERKLISENYLDTAYGFLKTLMGMDDIDIKIKIISEDVQRRTYPDLSESMEMALSCRPDYKAIVKKRIISEERVKIAEGRRLPDISLAGQYGGASGIDTGFRENWYYGLRLTLPILDGGSIRSAIEKEKIQLDKAREEERSLKHVIAREVRDAYLGILNAEERVEVANKGIESAVENLRVELLKYDTGAGMSQDVIDAQTVLLRAETDRFQAIFDREISVAFLMKAIGKDGDGAGVEK